MEQEILKTIIGNGVFAVMFFYLGRYALNAWAEDRKSLRELTERSIAAVERANVLMERLATEHK